MMERFLLYAGGTNHLVLFPELTLTGFTMKSREFALTRDSELIGRVRRMAMRYKTAVGFGCVIDENGSGPKNTYMIIDKEGNRIAEYAKMHPFSYAGEDRHYRPGNSLSTFTLEGVRFGITVCYDLRFPEIYQAYAESCDAVIVAANWPSKRAEHWNALLEARAIETQCFMIGVNCVRGMDTQYYRGDSRIIGPDGADIPYAWGYPEEEEKEFWTGQEIPTQEDDLWMPQEEEDRFPHVGETGILMAWVDEMQVQKARAAFPVRQDRRKELYRSLLG